MNLDIAFVFIVEISLERQTYRSLHARRLFSYTAVFGIDMAK